MKDSVALMLILISYLIDQTDARVSDDMDEAVIHLRLTAPWTKGATGGA